MPRDVKIFDIGQGTGIMGKLLHAEGYNDIEGADASENFVQVAAETGCYRRTRHLYFGMGVQNLPADMIGQYDLVVGVGVFGGDHIPKEGLDDAHAMLKTGGIFLTCLRKIYMDDSSNFGSKLQELIAAGKFELLKDWSFERGSDRSTFKNLAKMETYMMACRRID